MTKLQETVSLHLVRKGDPTKRMETPLEEDLPALLRQIQESASNNAGEKDKTEILAAPQKKMMWQFCRRYTGLTLLL
jgi:hypothetical protein